MQLLSHNEKLETRIYCDGNSHYCYKNDELMTRWVCRCGQKHGPTECKVAPDYYGKEPGQYTGD